MKKHSYQSLFLLTIILLSFVVLSYYFIWDAARQVSVFRATQFYYNMQHELLAHVTNRKKSFEQVLTDHTHNEISYQVMIITPSAQTFIHQFRREDQPNIPFFSLPYWQTSNPNDSAITLDADYLLGYTSLGNNHQLYVQIYYPPYILYWRPLYWLPILLALIFFFIAFYYTQQRKKIWQEVINYTALQPISADDEFTPLKLQSIGAGLEFMQLSNALNRINYKYHEMLQNNQQLTERLKRLVDQAPIPMLLIRKDCQIKFFNYRFEQVFMTAYQEGVTYHLTDFVTGADKSTHQILTKLDDLPITRILLVSSLEDNHDYQLYLNPWFNDNGEVQGFAAFLNDVSTFTHDINASMLIQQQQQDRLTELDSLLSEVAHELRTPLSGIIGMLSLISTEDLSPEQQSSFVLLNQACEAMMSMLNNMLDIAKVEAGRMQMEITHTDVFSLCQQVIDLMLAKAKQNHIELFFHIDPHCPRYLSTDAGKLRQSLLNLVSNAIKFTQSGHVALVVNYLSLDDKKLQTMKADGVSYYPRENTTHWLCFSIEDTGIGISDEEKQSLFSYFNQANDTISRKFGGTGLGLAFSYNYAQLLGGFIHVDSEINVGSTFSLCLPCCHEDYQPLYPYYANFSKLCLVAFVGHQFYANVLQTLADYLNITAIIKTTVDKNIIDETTLLFPAGLKPILLVEYELYTQKNNQHILDDLLKLSSDYNAAKILLSAKPERGISPSIREQYDSFLTEPLYASFLVAELNRLSEMTITHPNNFIPLFKHIDHSHTHKNDADSEQSSIVSTNNGHTQSDLTLSDIETTKTDIQLSTANNTTKTDPKLSLPEKETSFILVVEDNIINQKVACKLLEKLGYQCMVAGDGQQALQTLSAHRDQIDLILMDCRMPYMDGLEATRQIRKQQDDIPIIALTANDTDEDRLACKQAGMNEFLSKPLKKNLLEKMLNQFL
ncbi:response regulator [Psychrobacter sp. I-STPA10]|uniref:response regulator n=1 Tax=Psychrobacter sp. I-STPA10 TaxID=2585769 RepID=UPI001E2D13C3|nr:response regulator [Psychrobacter sp. I-STPA10]